MTVGLSGAAWLAGTQATGDRPDGAFQPAEPDLVSYRAAVGDLVAEVVRCAESDRNRAGDVLARRLGTGPFAGVLSRSADGCDTAITRLLLDVRNHPPSARGIGALVRISLLAQIDALWWGRRPGYRTDAEAASTSQLVDLDELYLDGQLRFSYRRQAATLLSRAARSAQRHALPGRSPRTAGLWLARGDPQVIAWLNQLAGEFARLAPPGTPALWVTSLVRSVEHQRHLASLGYVAPLPSAHCAGYAADIEMAWFRRFRAHRILRALLLDHQQAGEVNVIDEGQSWHVCLHPRLAVQARGDD